MKPPSLFYLLDGHSLLWRHFYAQGAPLTSLDGEPTKATFGFCQTLFRIVRLGKPKYLAVAMDGPRHKLVRRGWYEGYKANREKGELQEFAVQRKRVKQILEALNICTVQEEGWEADDVIASIARQYVSDEVHLRIVSRDHDLWRLLDDERVGIVVDPDTGEFLDRRGCVEQYGIGPELMEDMKTLAGCGGDNVPGVAGIAEKTACELLRAYKSFDAVLEAAREGCLRLTRKLNAVGDCVAAAERDGTLKLSRKLVHLKTNLRLELRAEDLQFDAIDWNAVQPIFRELNFKRWDKEFS